MNVSLPPQLDELVRRKVESGAYTSVNEIIQEALWLLEARDRLREMKLAELRKDIQDGLNSGPATPVDLEATKARGRQRLAEMQADHS